MITTLCIIGGFLAVFGTLLFLIDAFKVHWGWGLACLFLPFANIVCAIKNWGATKRGFLLSLAAIPFLAGAFFLMPKPTAHAVAEKGAVNDPFLSAMERARSAMAKVQDSRKEAMPVLLGSAPDLRALPTPPATVVPVAVMPPKPAATLAQRFTINRTAFKDLKTEFTALEAQRKALPRNDHSAIATFNLSAKAYSDKLAAARAEQEILLELNRTLAKAP